MRKSWKTAIVVLIAVLLAACSAGDTGTTTAAPSTNAKDASPAQLEPTPAATAPTETGTVADVPVASQEGDPVAGAKLNLNTASGDDYLDTIPGFSSRMLREFLEYRPYVSIRQFRQEIGKYVGADQVAEYEKYVYVPVDVDESDAETLKQLPGVDDTVAAALIAGRPYGSNAAFLARLAEYVSGADAQTAEAYLASN